MLGFRLRLQIPCIEKKLTVKNFVKRISIFKFRSVVVGVVGSVKVASSTAHSNKEAESAEENEICTKFFFVCNRKLRKKTQHCFIAVNLFFPQKR